MGSRWSCSPRRTNTTGWAIAQPAVRPVVVRSISSVRIKACSKSASAIGTASSRAHGAISGRPIRSPSPVKRYAWPTVPLGTFATRCVCATSWLSGPRLLSRSCEGTKNAVPVTAVE